MLSTERMDSAAWPRGLTLTFAGIVLKVFNSFIVF